MGRWEGGWLFELDYGLGESALDAETDEMRTENNGVWGVNPVVYEIYEGVEYSKLVKQLVRSN
jgi:hypothetical protein